MSTATQSLEIPRPRTPEEYIRRHRQWVAETEYLRGLMLRLVAIQAPTVRILINADTPPRMVICDPVYPPDVELQLGELRRQIRLHAVKLGLATQEDHDHG